MKRFFPPIGPQRPLHTILAHRFKIDLHCSTFKSHKPFSKIQYPYPLILLTADNDTWHWQCRKQYTFLTAVRTIPNWTKNIPIRTVEFVVMKAYELSGRISTGPFYSVGAYRHLSQDLLRDFVAGIKTHTSQHKL